MAHAVPHSDEQTAEMLVAQARLLDDRAERMREAARDLSEEAGRLRIQADGLTRAPVQVLPGAREIGKDARSRRRVLDMLESWGRCSVPQIVDHLALSRSRVTACLELLESEEVVKRVGIGAGTMWAPASDTAPGVRQGSSARAMIRDAARTLDVFTFEELSREVAVLADHTLRMHLPQLEADGVLTSERVGTRKLWEYMTPHKAGTTYTPARPRTLPPEVKMIAHARKRAAPVPGTGRGERPVSKDVADLLEAVTAAGGEIEKGSRHWQVKLDGEIIGTVPATPSDWRSLLNARAHLRRGGLEIP